MSEITKYSKAVFYSIGIQTSNSFTTTGFEVHRLLHRGLSG